MPRPRESEKKNVGVLNKNRKRKNSIIVLEHYYTSKRLWRTSKRGKLKGGALQFDFVQSNREFKLHVYGGYIQVENFLML